MHGGLLQVVSKLEARAPPAAHGVRQGLRRVAGSEQAGGSRSLYHPNGTGRGADDERARSSPFQGMLVHKAQREGDGR